MKILLAGDSTVCDQPRPKNYNPGLCYSGWGQEIADFFCGVQVKNFAVSGYTVSHFRESGQCDKLLAQLDPGGYVFFQFGHNDQKRTELRANGGYTAALTQYMHEIRQYSGIPILVTPVARNSWRGDNGQYLDLLADYANAMKLIAAKEDVPLIDLHDASKNWIISLGCKAAKRYFYPGDYTHPNQYGGQMWASMVASGIAQSQHPSLKQLQTHLKTTTRPANDTKQATQAIIQQHASSTPATHIPPLNIDETKADPVTGWLYPPKQKTDFAAWQSSDKPLTIADALQMAKEAYGWFVSISTDATPPQSDLECAKENGYLPANFPQSFLLNNMDAPITTSHFKAIMQTSCKGRNTITTEAASIPITGTGDTLTGKEAVNYAIRLERLATGAIPNTTHDPADTIIAGS